MYVIATVICPNFHFSVSPHVPFLNLLFEQIAIPTSIYLQNLASIQPRTSLVKFARSPCTDRPGHEAGCKRFQRWRGSQVNRVIIHLNHKHHVREVDLNGLYGQVLEKGK